MSSNKRSKETIDRLSALPDSLLIHVLTFMSLDSDCNARDAVRTSVLSKRWRYLWCDLTTLQFINNHSFGDIDEICKFVAMVDRTLLYRTAKSLEEFNLSFFYNQPWHTMWIHPTRYSPLKLLYTNSVLMELSMEFCTVAPRRQVNWKSFTKLRLECVELHQHVIENIFSGSPVMCSLELCGCWGFNSLKIDSTLLHELFIVIEEDDEDGMVEMLEISAPYLSILEIIFYPEGRKVRLKNIPAVVEVKVNIVGILRYYEGLPAVAIDAVKDLFDDIQHIKKLHMKTDFFLFVSKMMADGQQLQQQSRRLSLKIDNREEDHINSGVLSVLGSCSNLETLQLHEVTKKPPLSPLLMSDDLNCNLFHLKMVRMKISVTIGREISVESCPMLMLVRILLRRAVALEKMEKIRFEILNEDVKIEDRERFEKMVEEVLSWPKSSQALS